MDNESIDRIVDRHQGKAGALIQILLDVQAEGHWLTREALDRVSEKLGVPLSEVLRTASFHKAFTLVPRSRHEIHVCNGSSCHVRGAERIIDTVRAAIGAGPGETGPDLKFRMKTVACMGRCAIGPAMVVDGKHHSRVNAAEAEAVVKDCD